MKSIPAGFETYRKSPEFSESTVPAGLLARHTTKRGVWARITVREGTLRYRILEPAVEEHLLSADRVGVVEPEVPHEIEPVGTVRFRIEFLRRAEQEGSS